MCGIIGAISFGKVDPEMEKIRREATAFLVTELLQITQERGRDATGVSALFDDGNYFGVKMGIPSPEFIVRFGNKETDYNGFLEVIREAKAPMRVVMGHCRKSSVGNSKDNNNNHPIKVGNIIGVHNGTLTNHEAIFKKLGGKRDGNVDSEAIMRLIHYLSHQGKEPFTVKMMKEVCRRLRGTYSCIVFNGNNPHQITTFRDTRPAEIALIKPLKMAFIASKQDYLKSALIEYNKMSKLYKMQVQLPFLVKDDVEIRGLPDDTVCIFNLLADVKIDTKITDLYESEKLTLADKIWRETTALTNSYNTGNRAGAYSGNIYNHRKKIDNKTTDSNSTGEKNKVEVGVKSIHTVDKEKTGKVWNDGLKGYEQIEGLDETKKIGGVEIDADVGEKKSIHSDGKVNNVSDNKKNEKNIYLADVDNEKINTLVGDPAKVEDRPFPDSDKPDSDKKDNDKFINHLKEGQTKEIDVAVDADAMEKAEESARNLKIFENDDELLEKLDVSDEQVLKNVPLHVLANRIMKRMHKDFFYQGYTKRKEEKLSDKSAHNVVIKRTKAENNLKNLKVMTKILSKAVSHNTPYHNRRKIISSAVKEVFDKDRKLTLDDITNLITAGDIKDYPELGQLKLAIMEANGDIEE